MRTYLVALAGNAHFLLDRGTEGRFIDPDGEFSLALLSLLLLLGLGQVELQEGLEVVRHRVLGDGVDVLEGVGGRGEGLEGGQLDDFAEASHVGIGSLDCLGALVDLIGRGHLKERVARSSLVEEVESLNSEERKEDLREERVRKIGGRGVRSSVGKSSTLTLWY